MEFSWVRLILIALLLGLWLCFWYMRRKSRMEILQRCGIPGPKPHLLWGNMTECFRLSNVIWDTNLVNEYGPISGYYLGAKPFVLIADPELLYNIESKLSANFLDRPRKVPGGINPDPKRDLMMGNLPVPKWRNVRKVLTPCFSPAKLKEMIPKLTTLTSKMLGKVEFYRSTEINFYSLFQTLTLDIIGSIAFGVDSNIQDNPNDPLLKAVEAEFSKTTNSALIKLYLCLPEISFLLQPLRKYFQLFKNWFQYSETSALWNHGRAALNSRRAGEDRGFDLLQLLLKSDLTEDQIVANSVLFLEAGYETLSGSLGFITYLLVKHPHVQDKLREELDSFVKTYGSLDTYNIMNHLKYLDAVIKEGLRLYPPQTTFIGRSPSKTYEFTKDEHTYILQEGVHIQVALFQIQNSSDNWTDSNEFNPDRYAELPKSAHSADNVTWQAFGLGPRRCIGERFANLVLKLVLSKLFFTYQLSSSRESGLSIQYKVATMTPQHGVWAHALPAVQIEP